MVKNNKKLLVSLLLIAAVVTTICLFKWAATPALADSGSVDVAATMTATEVPAEDCCTPCCNMTVEIDNMKVTLHGSYVAESDQTVTLFVCEDIVEELPWGQHSLEGKTYTLQKEGECTVRLVIEGLTKRTECFGTVVAEMPTPTPTATNTPTPTSTPTNTPTLTPTPTNTPTLTPTATPFSCLSEPTGKCRIFLPWTWGNFLKSATTLLQDPQSCKDELGLRQGDVDTSDGVLRPTQDSCAAPQIVRIPKESMTWENGQLRTYVLTASGSTWRCYIGVVYTRVVNPGEEHIDKFACITDSGSILRGTKLGHERYGVDPGTIMFDRGPGTAATSFVDLEELAIDGITIKPIDYYFPGADYEGKPPGEAISFMFGDTLEIVVAQDRSPDPGRISGRLRAHAWSNANLNFEGLIGYGLRGELVPEDISALIVGTAEGYPPVGAASMTDALTWNTSNIPDEIRELFSDDWEQVP